MTSVRLTDREWQSVLTILEWIEHEPDEHPGTQETVHALREKIQDQLDDTA